MSSDAISDEPDDLRSCGVLQLLERTATAELKAVTSTHDDTGRLRSDESLAAAVSPNGLETGGSPCRRR
jgi:hypothetical protein